MKLKANITAVMAGAALLGAISNKASAQGYLVTVDVSDPAAVTITGTGNYAQVADNTTTTGDGAYLLNFFTGDSDFSGDMYDTLSWGGSGSVYDTSFSRDADGSGNEAVDLSFYESFGDTPQNFTTSTPAFTGVGTLDLSAYASLLPAPGSFGDIRPGFGSGLGQVIGQWQVVPEPGVTGLAGLSALGLILSRRRR